MKDKEIRLIEVFLEREAYLQALLTWITDNKSFIKHTDEFHKEIGISSFSFHKMENLPCKIFIDDKEKYFLAKIKYGL